MSSPSLSSLETTKKNIRILKQKLELGRDLVERSIADDGLDVDLSLTRVDAARLCSVRRARKLKRDNQLELIKDIATSKETKLNLINDSEDECLSFGDDANEGQLSDSSGAQSAPKNDYNQYFVDTGHRPQNFIRDPGLTERFEEYPKLRELIKLKDELIAKTNVPVRPMCIKSDLLGKNGDDFDLNELIGSEFDVILVEPPLHEYQITNKIYFNRFYTWEEIKAIDIGSIAASRSFIFLWCGSADGLDKGRECLKKWGFRRCEDICWIKTNKQTKTSDRVVNSTGIFQRTKEHCLMGIKGTVKRSSDTNFIHTNIDIDLIISEEPDPGVPDKPEEIFNIIEHFCLGKRRLYLFGGRHDQIRQGWLTVGPDLTQTYFDRELFRNSFLPDPNAVAGGGNLTGTTERIEMLRPRTPPAKQQPAQAVNKPITSSSVLTEVVPTDAQL